MPTWSNCPFCRATGRQGCLSCEGSTRQQKKEAATQPLQPLLTVHGTPDQDPIGWGMLKAAFSRDALESATDEHGLNLRAVEHNLVAAGARLVGLPIPQTPPAAGAGAIATALDRPADESLTQDLYDMIMLEIAHSPVLAKPGDTLNQAVNVSELDNGQYQVHHADFAEPQDASAVQMMRARFMAARDTFTKTTGRMVPTLPCERSGE